MKVEQKDKDFQPITITLENRYEVERFRWFFLLPSSDLKADWAEFRDDMLEALRGVNY